MRNNDELIEDVFGLGDLDEEGYEAEDLNNDDPSQKRVVRKAKEGVNSVRLSQNDSDILDFMQNKGAFSTYVKKLIRAEIDRQSRSVESVDTVTKVEFDALNDKLNQVLTMLQQGVQISTADDDSQSPQNEDAVVFENENAHKFNQQALSAVAGILGNQLKK